MDTDFYTQLFEVDVSHCKPISSKTAFPTCWIAQHSLQITISSPLTLKSTPIYSHQDTILPSTSLISPCIARLSQLFTLGSSRCITHLYSSKTPCSGLRVPRSPYFLTLGEARRTRRTASSRTGAVSIALSSAVFPFSKASISRG